MILEGDTLLQLQKLLYAIRSASFLYLSKNKIWTPYKKIKAENYVITKFILPPDTHPKYITAKENVQSFSRALGIHLVKDATISSSKAP